jgi:hypothetical protein
MAMQAPAIVKVRFGFVAVPRFVVSGMESDWRRGKMLVKCYMLLLVRVLEVAIAFLFPGLTLVSARDRQVLVKLNQSVCTVMVPATAVSKP